jgi:L-rhamnose mutarotase
VENGLWNPHIKKVVKQISTPNFIHFGRILQYLLFLQQQNNSIFLMVTYSKQNLNKLSQIASDFLTLLYFFNF